MQSLQSTLTVWVGAASELPLWYFALFIFVAYSPLVWVRTIEFFSKTFFLAAICILTAVVTTAVYAGDLVMQNDGPGPDITPINSESYFLMIGFAFFMFEGIGCLLPVMRETAVPDAFPYLAVAALGILTTIYIAFSSLCYYAWGTDLNESVVTEMLPADNVWVQVMKLVFCVNLVFSYPLTVTPAWHAGQELFFGTKENENERYVESRVLYWSINMFRSALLGLTLLVTLYVSDSLDKVISVAGAVFGMTNVLLIPSLCHYILLADSKWQKGCDIAIMVFAGFMLVFGPATIIASW
jgi:amino acid permease